MHYYWFKKQRDTCQRDQGCDMGGFTRLLHSGQADDLMDEARAETAFHLARAIHNLSYHQSASLFFGGVSWRRRQLVGTRGHDSS